jgi:hypothetical protein
VAVIVWLAGFAHAAEPQPTIKSYQDIGRSLLIVGQTGKPIGETILVRGVKKTRAKGPAATFEAATVNGQKLVTILNAPAIAHWPDGTQAVLRGREVGRVGFRYGHQLGLQPKEAASYQAHQDIILEFVPDEVVEPRELKLRSEPTGVLPDVGKDLNSTGS